MSERHLKTLEKFADFQAEYEGSIPFTRSNSYFNDLVGNLSCHSEAIATILLPHADGCCKFASVLEIYACALSGRTWKIWARLK